VFLMLWFLPGVMPRCVAESKSKEAAALMERARQLSDIRADGSPSFILKVEFRILRDATHSIDGIYTETWISRSLSRTEISAGGYHRTEIVNENRRWELSTPSEMDRDINSAPNTIAYRVYRLPLDADTIANNTIGSWQL